MRYFATVLLIGLRDYGTARWEGGSADCSHEPPPDWYERNFNQSAGERIGKSSQAASAKSRWYKPDGSCECGAVRVDGQIGLEPTPEAYIARLVDVFREVLRVLADDGTLWVNIGDSYAGGGTIGRNDTDAKSLARRAEKYGTGQQAGSFVGAHGTRPKVDGLKQKDLIGIPWMLAFALRADGWYLRSEIIWHKPNPMPESVKDRPTKAHEQIFLLSKSPKYFYDADAVKEPNAWPDHNRFGNKNAAARNVSKLTGNMRPDAPEFTNRTGRNRRSVWTVTPKPYKEAHFATFPPDLIKPCILAGCPEGGTVLDPFGGSGTTAQVAIENHRQAVLIELNPDYIELIRKRLANVQPKQAKVLPLLAACGD